MNLSMAYIADMLNESKPNRPLRSVGSSQLEMGWILVIWDT